MSIEHSKWVHNWSRSEMRCLPLGAVGRHVYSWDLETELQDGSRDSLSAKGILIDDHLSMMVYH